MDLWSWSPSHLWSWTSGSGLLVLNLHFIINNGGIDSEEDYPYKARDGTCDQYRKNTKVVRIDDYEDVPENNEKALQKAVANQPVSVAMKLVAWHSNSMTIVIQLYKHLCCYDIFVLVKTIASLMRAYSGKCRTTLDHGVTAVGYGTENGVKYWIVKNSWGASWGESGHIRMERNAGYTGKCGIAMEASYPIKNGQNPPNSGPSILQQIKKMTKR
ncbi:putative cysteine protease RD21B [Camellia lanceoleosa]|uniref:Cysteine protease RD21B n=1 Tax=Camellia lanceoleosa TaxID=1840588 RepID=A0ACC0FPM5_9ERIC|nr:putative cysteine protease RD21B [Camellia lanceoleosa]